MRAVFDWKREIQTALETEVIIDSRQKKIASYKGNRKISRVDHFGRKSVKNPFVDACIEYAQFRDGARVERLAYKTTVLFTI